VVSGFLFSKGGFLWFEKGKGRGLPSGAGERPNGPGEKVSGVPFARQRGRTTLLVFQGQGGAAVEKIDFRFFFPPGSPQNFLRPRE